MTIKHTTLPSLLLAVLPLAADAATLAGRVTQSDGQTPLAGAQIQARTEWTGPGVQATATDAEGRYQLVDLPAGAYKIRAAAPGFYPEWRELNVTAELDREDVDFVLLRPGRISGRVFDEQNEPLRNAAVRVYTGDWHQGWRRVTTDAEGRYTVDGVRPGRLSLAMFAEGTAETWRRDVHVREGEETASVDLKLRRAGSLRLRLRRPPDDEPLARQSIACILRPQFEGAGFTDRSWPSQETNDQGEVTLGRLLPGEYELEVRFNDMQVTQRVTVAAGEETPVDLPFTGEASRSQGPKADSGLAEAGTGFLSVRVLPPAGLKPLPSAPVDLTLTRRTPRGDTTTSRAARTDAEGLVAVGPVEPGTYDVTVWVNGYAPGTRERVVLEAGDHLTIALRLPHGGAVAGRVIRGATGQPIAGAQVDVLPQAAFDRWGQMPTGPERLSFTRGKWDQTDAAGNFHVDRLEPGLYAVRATLGRQVLAWQEGVVVEEGQTVSNLELRVPEPTVGQGVGGFGGAGGSGSVGQGVSGFGGAGGGGGLGGGFSGTGPARESAGKANLSAPVPLDHWAYQALADLAETGLLAGYPGGTFQGKQPLTRQEFAEALVSLWNVMQAPSPLTGRGGVGPEEAEKPVGKAGQKKVPLLGSIPMVGELFPAHPRNATWQRLVQEFRPELEALGWHFTGEPWGPVLAETPGPSGPIPDRLTAGLPTADRLTAGLPTAAAERFGLWGAIGGRIVDEEEQPLRLAEIDAALEQRQAEARRAEERRFQTDAEGRYRVDQVASGEYDVHVAARGYAEQKVPNVTVRPGTVTDSVNFRLVRGGRVQGQVVDWQRRPVPDAEIWWEKVGETVTLTGGFQVGRGGRLGTRTGANGRYALEELPPGLYRIGARKGGFLPDLREEVAVVAHATVQVDLRLGRGGAVIGTVFQADGQTPAAGVLVSATPAAPDGAAQHFFAAAQPLPSFGSDGSDRAGMYETQTDDTGRYVLPGLRAGVYCLTAWEPGGGLAQRRAVIVREGREQRGIDLVLGEVQATNELNVQVVGPEGQPLPEARVAVTQSQQAVAHVVETDQRGEVLVQSLAPGEAEIVAQQPGFAPSRLGVQFQSRRRGDLTVTLSRGGKISGRLVDGNDRSERLEVVACPPEAEPQAYQPQSPYHWLRFSAAPIGPDGTYALPDLAPGLYTVFVRERSTGEILAVQTRIEVTAQTETKGIDFRLSEVGTVAGRVVRAADGAAVPSAQVVADLLAPGQRQRPLGVQRVAQTDEAGRFQLAGLPPGRWRLQARHPELAPLARTIRVEAGDEALLTLTLPVGGAIRGRVILRETGEPVPGLPVYLGDDPRPAAVTTPDGHFHLAHVAPDDYRLRAETNGLVTVEEPTVVVREGEEAGVEIVITEERGELRGAKGN